MEILIVGGSRFVGPCLVRRLLREGHDITLFNRGRVQSEYRGVRFLRGDRNDGFNIRNRFDAVIDMCAYTGRHTEGALKQLKSDFFVHMSTVAVYKKPHVFPMAEDSPLGDWPLWGAYNRGKVECERVLDRSGRPFATIRPVYILGPENYVDREHFIYASLKGRRPIVLPGNGQAIVQFVFADEVAEAVAEIVDAKIPGAFNCAGDESITLEGLVREMAAISGQDPLIRYNAAADGAQFNESEFPFANENVVCRNEKIKSRGVRFTPLLNGLKRDYTDHYSKMV